ncbi:glycosyltransferase family 4 protein [Pontibacter sp. KCTC 32443]|uniref:glycosyltransferase family 4 protein n=1 Tax=Pontibacter TaxID=323449 RepID=UPI00164D19AE|nr:MULTISPECIES: glycosyltransferase family 1 protein [Pontibacter]MBC5773486.1 glycosyltransferase family 4 protein [Pontibacter sp. KCTC 32443]
MEVQKEFPGDVHYTNYVLSRHSSGVWNRIKLIWEAFKNKGTINHITGDINFIAALLPKNKTILTIHDIESLERKNKIANYLLNFLWLKLPIAKVKYVTVVSETTKQKLISKLEVDPSKVIVIPNIISPLYKCTFKEFDNNKPTILQVGTKYNKNLERCIAALKGLSCRLVIVGSLNVEQLQLLQENKIDFINYNEVSGEELRNLYAEADIVSFVSLFEGFGLPILEAQATGKPVLTSNCSAMPEVAGSGALFVDPYSIEDIRNGFTELINSEGLRNDLVRKGLDNCSRFSNKAIAQCYIDLYKQI